MNKPLVMCNDVGYRNWGWSIISPAKKPIIIARGTIYTKPCGKKKKIRVADDDTLCTQQLLSGLLEIIDQYEIGGLAFEMPNAGARGSRPIVGMARSSAVAACLEVITRLPVEYVTPDDVKRVVKSKGAVTKEEVIAKVRELFEIDEGEELGEHEADSLAVYQVVKDGMMVKLLSR